jgi:hypothetical protein
LLSPNILQSAIQVHHLLHNIINLGLVRALDLARLANCQIQKELDGAMNAAAIQPAAPLYILGREAEPVLAGVGSGEGETTLAGAPLGDDSVVAVEDFLDCDEDTHVGFGCEAIYLFVPNLGIIMAYQGEIQLALVPHVLHIL